jgi:hypothetical protein
MAKKTIDVMIDIETLGKKPNCPVISIGAVAFDLTTTYGSFYAALDVEEQIDSGKRIADASTIKWWMSQSGAAKTVFKEDAIDTKTGLEQLALFLSTFDDVYVWGNGATFDITILESIFDSYKVEIPWKYSHIMDQRTIKRFLGKGIKIKREGTYHNAIDDAMTQAKFIQECLGKYYAKG